MGSATSAVSPWFATASLNAPELRYGLAALLGASPAAGLAAESGVFPRAGTDPFAPVSNGSAGAPSLSVAPGQCAIQRPTGGTYIGTWDVAKTVPVDTPLPAAGQTRIDRLVADITDDEADGGSATSDRVKLRVRTATGTPASSPTAPAVPAGAIPLWRYTINNAGAISAINSERSWTRAAGAPRLVEDTDTRAGSYPGDLRVFRSGRIDAWVGGTWVTVVAPAAWKQTNAVFSYAGAGAIPAGSITVGDGASSVRWKQAGKDLQVQWTLRCGTPTGGGAGQITTVLPDGLVAARAAWFPCHLFCPGEAAPINAPRVDVSGMAYVAEGTSIVYPFFPIGIISSSGIDLREACLANTFETGTRGYGVPKIPNGFPLVAGSALTIGSAQLEVQ